MKNIHAHIVIFDKNGNARRNYHIVADNTVQILKHIEWENIIVRNWEKLTYEVSLYAQDKYNATKIMIEYHFIDGDITTETITTLEK